MPFNEAVSRTLRSLLRPHVFHTMNQVITMRHIGHRRGLHLAMSLFTVLKGDSLPPEGQTLTSADQCCDPYNSICKTPLDVWETKCPRCGGSGMVRNSTGGHGSRRGLASCLACSGMGFVRHVSADETSARDVYTLNRADGEPPLTECPTRPKNPWEM